MNKMNEDELMDKHNKMVYEVIKQCDYIIANREYLNDIGIKNTVSKIRDIVNYYHIKEPEEEPEEAAVKYVRAILEFPELYASTGHEEDFLRGIDKTKIEKVLNELEKKDKIIKLMIKHLCNVIDNDSDASLLPFYDSDDDLEEKVKKYFERKAEDE